MAGKKAGEEPEPEPEPEPPDGDSGGDDAGWERLRQLVREEHDAAFERWLSKVEDAEPVKTHIKDAKEPDADEPADDRRPPRSAAIGGRTPAKAAAKRGQASPSGGSFLDILIGR